MNKLWLSERSLDAIETPFSKTDKILGGAGTLLGFPAFFYSQP
jgi:hypothetical protein